MLIVELHLDDFDIQHIASFRTPHFDRAGGTVDERHGDVSLRQLLSKMADSAVVDVYRAFDDGTIPPLGHHIKERIAPNPNSNQQITSYSDARLKTKNRL